MKELELLQPQVSTPQSYDVEVIEQVEPHPASKNADAEARLHPIRTICLADCAIPE
ncbi:MAG TPA: hypothetical protein VIH72_05840 [Candidatus Acidoferrales bacterium]|jgi:hypothetical protein